MREPGARHGPWAGHSASSSCTRPSSSWTTSAPTPLPVSSGWTYASPMNRAPLRSRSCATPARRPSSSISHASRSRSIRSQSSRRSLSVQSDAPQIASSEACSSANASGRRSGVGRVTITRRTLGRLGPRRGAAARTLAGWSSARSLHSDWPDVARIYERGPRDRRRDLRDGAAFMGDLERRASAGAAARCRARRGVVGWVAVSRVSRRPAYRGVVEHSIYVDAGARGSGVGRTLLEALVAEAPTTASGRSRRRSSRRTRRACGSTRDSASASWAGASGSRSWTEPGATRSSWSCASPKTWGNPWFPREAPSFSAVARRPFLTSRPAKPACRSPTAWAPPPATSQFVTSSACFSRASGGRRRRRCGRRSRTSSTRRSRPARAAPRSGCSRGRTRGRRPPG